LLSAVRSTRGSSSGIFLKIFLKLFAPSRIYQKENIVVIKIKMGAWECGSLDFCHKF
jgi:hypothetical protein